MRFANLALAALAAVAFCAAPPAQGDVLFHFFQNGADVDALATGSINLTGLTLTGSGGGMGDLYPSIGSALVGGNNYLVDFDVYSGVTGPTSFGGGGFTPTTSRSGDAFGILGAALDLRLPQGYVSGTSINSSAVFAGQTLNSLGLTPGTYVYTLANSAVPLVTVQIGAAVPELSTFLGFGSFLAIGGLAAFRQRKQARKAA